MKKDKIGNKGKEENKKRSGRELRR